MILIVYIIAGIIGWQINGLIGMLAALVLTWIGVVLLSVWLTNLLMPDKKD